MQNEEKFKYFQFHKDLNYSIFLKIEDNLFNDSSLKLFTELGFDEIDYKLFSSMPVKAGITKLLKINKAGHRAARQISSAFIGFEKYGNENLSSQGSYSVYRYKSLGMMIFSDTSYEWELGLVDFEKNMQGLKVVLNRFLSLALKNLSVLSFWAIPVDEGFVIMNQAQSLGEAIFIDIKNNKMLTQDGSKDLPVFLNILKLDSSLRQESRVMSREELLSLLSTKLCYISQTGVIDYRLKDSLFSLLDFSQGLHYPEDNFQARSIET